MTPAEIDRVFGRGRLRMTTGEHVEVFREEARDGEERRYTKRFLETASGDFRAWTEREWRILDRLGARGDAAVAKVVRYFPVDGSGMARLQTRDAGPTVDQWAALVPLRRTAPVLPYVFGDCANWWALARQCLIALDPLHALGFVHLDLKPDNVCIPTRPAYAGRPAAGEPLAPDFDGLALIDVAFSLLPEIELPAALPLARDPGYEYQSPRLLEALDDGRRGNVLPTQTLDWRCDLFSLAAMLWRYLPELDEAAGTGWSSQRHAAATQFVTQLMDIHAAPLPAARPHRSLIGEAALRLTDPQLTASLQTGSSFDPDRAWRRGAESVPLTRVVATLPARPPAAARREPSFASPAPAPVAAAVSPPPASPAPPPVAPPSPPPVALHVPPPRTAANLAAPAARAQPAATSVAPPVAVPEPAPAVSPPAPRAGATVVSAVAGSLDSPAVAQAATRPAPSVVKASATTVPIGVARPAPAGATRHDIPLTARDASSKPSSTPTSTSTPSTTTAAATRTPAPSDTRSPAPPRAASPWPERPRPPARTPMPILAAAGIAALLVALAAWWGLDGRAQFERMSQRRAAPATADVAAARPAPAAPAAAASDAATMSAAAPPTTTDAPGAPATAPPATPSATPEVAAANEPAAASAVDANAPRSVAQPAPASDFEAAAGAWLTNRLPRVAQAAERQLAPVLRSGARSTELRRRGDVRAAMQAARSSAAATVADVPASAREARSLNEAALVAYWRDNSVPDALRLQTQAFGANPSDPEVAGNLAFLLLKEKPPQAEAARQLALHALTQKDDRFPSGRIEDWTTLAIADALTGRDADARNAWFVSMALTGDLQRQCNAAIRAQATYGERLRPSVQAMLQRARSSAAYGRCEVQQTAQQPSGQETAAAQPSAQRKPARKPVKSKSTQKARRAIP